MDINTPGHKEAMEIMHKIAAMGCKICTETAHTGCNCEMIRATMVVTQTFDLKET